MAKNSKSKSGSVHVKLSEGQRKLIETFVAAIDLHGAKFKILNERYSAFEAMVLALPCCESLSSDDVVTIVVNPILTDVDRIDPDAREAELVSYYVNLIESLPRAYTLKISLPGMRDWGDFDLQISDEIKVVSRSVPPDKSTFSLHNLAQQTANGRRVFLEVGVRGFASHSPDSQAVSDGLGMAKLSAFLLAAVDAVDGHGFYERRSVISVHDHLTGQEFAVTVPDRLAAHFGGFEPDSSLKFVEPGLGLLGAFHKPETDEQWIEAFGRQLKGVERVFSRRHRAGFGRIAAAIEWHQDSISGDDQTMAFLAACIGLESLLGDENQQMMGEMTQRLTDRYAFMLGRDREDRERLAGEYKEVLKKRGELVHARARRLRGRDLQLLHKVQRMLELSIKHELGPFLSETN